MSSKNPTDWAIGFPKADIQANPNNRSRNGRPYRRSKAPPHGECSKLTRRSNPPSATGSFILGLPLLTGRRGLELRTRGLWNRRADGSCGLPEEGLQNFAVGFENPTQRVLPRLLLGRTEIP